MPEATVLPADFPAYLTHSDEDTPVPTWKQVTRSTESVDHGFVAHLARIVAGTNDEHVAIETWESWPGNYRRSIGLLVDKICHEGWLDSVGQIRGTPWDGGFFFWPNHGYRDLAEVLDSKSIPGGAYTRCTYRAGLTARLGRWGHKAWKRGWIENDTPLAALHVGVFKDGSAEVHLDVFNPLCISGTAPSDITRWPLIGSYNHKLFSLHRGWEQSKYGAIARTSANFYHLMRGQVPLSF